MKKIILILLAGVMLTACSNHGKKVKVDGTKGEVYYKGDGVTEADAKKTGDFLKTQGYFTAENGSSVQVMKDGENYTMRFVYDKKIFETLEGAENAFKGLAIKAATEIFGGKKVTIALADKSFKDYKTIPYDEAMAKEMTTPAPTEENTVAPEETTVTDDDVNAKDTTNQQ